MRLLQSTSFTSRRNPRKPKPKPPPPPPPTPPPPPPPPLLPKKNTKICTASWEQAKISLLYPSQYYLFQGSRSQYFTLALIIHLRGADHILNGWSITKLKVISSPDQTLETQETPCQKHAKRNLHYNIAGQPSISPLYVYSAHVPSEHLSHSAARPEAKPQRPLPYYIQVVFRSKQRSPTPIRGWNPLLH